MEKFQKLSRAEMKKVGGGTEGPCQTGKACFYYANDGIPTNGTCSVVGGSCNCVGNGTQEVNAADCSNIF